MKRAGFIFLVCFAWILSCVLYMESLAGNDREELKESYTVRVAYCEDMPPFQFTDGADGASGLHIDLLNQMAENGGIEIIYVPFSSRNQCIEALKQGDVDIVLGFPMGNIDNRRYQVTGELSKATVCMVVKKNSSKPFSKAVFELGSIDYAYMQSMGIKQYIAVDSQADVAQLLMDGDVDVALGTAESLDYILNRASVREEYRILHDQISYISYSILLPSDNQRLRTILDTELAELRTSGEYEDIYRNWIVDRDLKQAEKTIRSILVLFAEIGFAAVIIIAIVAYLNRMLRRRVSEKTKELHRANLLLEEQVTRLKREGSLRNRIIGAVPTGILFLDDRRNVTLVNTAVCRMCGRTQAELSGRAIEQLPLFGPLAREIESHMMREGEEKQPYLLEQQEAEKCRKYRCWQHFLNDASGGALLMIEDVTLEEQYRQEMYEKEKVRVLEQLVAGIAHELKNPLMNLKTAVSLILTQGDRKEVKEAFARFIPDEVDRMNRLVEGLLNYSKPIRKKTEAVRVCEVVKNCLYLTQIAAKGNQIRFSVEMDEELMICVQRDLLRQSFINLLLNSIWSIEKKREECREVRAEGAEISVRVFQKENMVCISFYDRGVGMNAEECRRCMEPFYTTKKAGTGLGLALTKQFVEENGGMLTIRSEAGKFAEVQMCFRRYEEDEKQYFDS